LIKPVMVLLVAFSLAGCAGIPKPKTDLCIVNAPNENRKCYAMDKDYDDTGKLKPGAVPVYRKNTALSDLNKFLVIDSPTGTIDGQAELKAWLQKLRSHYANCQSGN
jgi:hypothetical protein